VCYPGLAFWLPAATPRRERFWGAAPKALPTLTAIARMNFAIPSKISLADRRRRSAEKWSESKNEVRPWDRTSGQTLIAMPSDSSRGGEGMVRDGFAIARPNQTQQ
jgi:hypothetical protein